MRKLLPALYYRYRDGQIPDESRIVGTARSPLSRADYQQRAHAALSTHVQPDALDDATVQRFLNMVYYVSLNGAEADSNWPAIRELLGSAPASRIRVYYLATSPALYGQICENLSRQELITEQSRVVLEKPIGTTSPARKRSMTALAATSRKIIFSALTITWARKRSRT